MISRRFRLDDHFYGKSIKDIINNNTNNHQYHQHNRRRPSLTTLVYDMMRSHRGHGPGGRGAGGRARPRHDP